MDHARHAVTRQICLKSKEADADDPEKKPSSSDRHHFGGCPVHAGCLWNATIAGVRWSTAITNMATYEGDRTQCVNVAMQAQAEYDRREKEQRQSNMTVGFIIGAIAGAAVGSATGEAGDGARSSTAACRTVAMKSSMMKARGCRG